MAKDTRRHLDEAVKAITNWLGRPAAIEDLRPETINKYLVEYLESGRSPYTVKSRRTGLLVLLRRAIRLGLVDDVDVKDVRAVHCPALRIDGYDLNDMDRLIAHCATLRGVQSKTGISQSIYFASAILTMWNLGNRPGDIVEIDVADFDPRGFFYVTEQKTGKARARALQSSTKGAIAACIAVDPRRKKIWPGMKARSFYKKIGRIAAAAGLSGTARWIRRGAASVVESKNAGSARRFLNHSVPTLFEKHYRVERIVDPSPIAPTELDVPAAVFESIEPRAPLDPVEYQRRRDVNNAACRRYRERGGKAVQE
jgi:integrase